MSRIMDPYTSGSYSTRNGHHQQMLMHEEARHVVARFAMPSPPPAQHYAPPPSQHYAPPPSQHYAPPPSQHYAPPPSQHYAPPPSQHYAPQPSQHYAPPPRQVPHEMPRVHTSSAHQMPSYPMSEQHMSYQQRYNNYEAAGGPPMKSSYGMQQRQEEMVQPPRVPRPPSPNMMDNTSRFPQQAGNVATAFPRSASEALFDTSTKFRQLPCRTFISVGTCPYRERCVYLHDPRCICREAKTKTRRKNKEDVVVDALFWPVMPYPMVAAKLDANRQPHVIQPYSVPLPQADQYRRHDTEVYSMWMHFVDFCLANSEGSGMAYPDACACFSAPDVAVNSYTQLPRLAVFRTLCRSNGRPLSADDFKQSNQKLSFMQSDSMDEIDGSAAEQRNNDKTRSPITVTGAFDASPHRAVHSQQTAFGPSPYGSAFSEQQPVPSIFKSIWGEGGGAADLNVVDSGSPIGVEDAGSPACSGVDQKQFDVTDISEFVHGFSVDSIISY